jgi:2-polyprenyl-3-methyl-5-hydroxy-6-metoxy-1,4-benzoquinol methylase
MKSVSEQMSSGWADAYELYRKKGDELAYPSETLVRLFKGDYVTGQKLDFKGKSVLDVGFGGGNNTLFLASLGMQVSGVEIHQDICDLASKEFSNLGLQVDLRVGTNQEIPFENNSFDFLVSWNVLHYEGTEEGILSGIKEYARVLKPEGRLFLSTTGPQHKILKNSQTLGNHLYQIGRDDDFRKGQVHFFFDNINYLEFYFSSCFQQLQIGRIEDVLFREKLDWYLVTGVKA